MSQFHEKTERKALLLLACTLRYFDRLHGLKMTTMDDFDACGARNLIRCIIESSGYKAITQDGKRTRLVKTIR